MANQTAQGVSTNNILTPGYPLVGGDTPGTNLTIRSTNNPNKGTVLIDEYTASYGSNSGALQTLGGIGAQHNVSVGGALYNLPYGYSVTNVISPQGGGGYYPGFSQIVPILNTSVSSQTATITFPTQTLQNTFSATTSILTSVQYGTLTANNTTGAFTIGTAQSAGFFIVGQIITITGTPNTAVITGYSPGSSYVISVTNGTSTFTLQNPGYTPITTVATAVTGLTLTVNGYNQLSVVNNSGLFFLTTTNLPQNTFSVGQIVTITGSISASTIVNGGVLKASLAPSAVLSDGSTNLFSINATSVITLATPASIPLFIGQQVKITGSFSSGSITGYSTGNVYFVIATNSTNQFTISSTVGGAAVGSTASTGNVTGVTINYGNVFTLATAYGTNLLTVGQAITLTNALSTGVLNASSTTTSAYGSGPTTFFIAATNGTTQFSLAASAGGIILASNASTGQFTSAAPNITLNHINGYTTGNNYVIASTSSGSYANASPLTSPGILLTLLNTSGGSLVTTSAPGANLTADTSGTTYGVLVAGNGGAFTLGVSQSAGTFQVGMTITISGTQGTTQSGSIVNYTDGNIYTIVATNGTSTFTLYQNNLPITTTLGVLSGVFNTFTGAGTTTVTVQTFNSASIIASGTPMIIGNNGSAISGSMTIGGVTIALNQTYYIAQTGVASIQLYSSAAAAIAGTGALTVSSGTTTNAVFYIGANTILKLNTQYGIVTGLTLATTYVPFQLSQQVTVAGNTGGYNGTYNVASVSTSTITVFPSLGSGSTSTGVVTTAQYAGTNTPNIVVTVPVLTGGATASALPQMIGLNLQTTAASGSGSVATLTFATQTYPPFYVGQVITVSNIVPLGYQGTYVVTSCSVTQVTYANTTSGSQTVVGVISSQGVQQVAINNPGTGYLSPPLINFQDPSPIVAQLYTASLIVATGQYVKAIQSTTGTGGSAALIFFYYVYSGGTMNATQPTLTTGFIVSGTSILLFVGTNAQAYGVLGYTSILAQGSLVQMGCISNGVIVAVGSNYTSAPIVTFSQPDMPGGRLPYATVTVSGGAINGFYVEDPGSGYLNVPKITLTNVGTNQAGSGGIIAAVLANPGEKAIVSNMPTSFNNNYYIDFGQTGNNVVFITNGTTTANIYFDFTTATSGANGAGATPYEHAFPLGRRVVVWFKNIGGAACTVTFQNLAAANSNTGANTATVTNGRTGKFEFNVLTTSNLQSNLASAPGGHANDVFATIVST